MSKQEGAAASMVELAVTTARATLRSEKAPSWRAVNQRSDTDAMGYSEMYVKAFSFIFGVYGLQMLLIPGNMVRAPHITNHSTPADCRMPQHAR